MQLSRVAAASLHRARDPTALLPLSLVVKREAAAFCCERLPPSPPPLPQFVANCEQLLTTRYSRRLIVMEVRDAAVPAVHASTLQTQCAGQPADRDLDAAPRCSYCWLPPWIRCGRAVMSWGGQCRDAACPLPAWTTQGTGLAWPEPACSRLQTAAQHPQSTLSNALLTLACPTPHFFVQKVRRYDAAAAAAYFEQRGPPRPARPAAFC